MIDISIRANRMLRTTLDGPKEAFKDSLDFRRIGRNHERNKDGGRKLEKCRSGTAVLISSGKSADLSNLPAGDIVAAGAMVATRLNAAGIVPDWMVTCSPELDRLPKAKGYVIATQCSPRIFREGNFHYAAQPGDTDASVALPIASLLGYSSLHLIGYDSSGYGPLTAGINGRTFKTDKHQVNQLHFFLRISQELVEMGINVYVHGDGLLPFSAKSIRDESPYPIDEAHQNHDVVSPNYDFITVLVVARMAMNRAGKTGPIKFVFSGSPGGNKDTGMSMFARKQMIDNVMRPAMPFFGAVEDPSLKTDRIYTPSYRAIAEGYWRGEKVPKIRIGADRDPRKLSITLRECDYSTVRNSNLDAWVKFAERRKADGYNVVIVRDTAKAESPVPGFEICPEASRDLHARILLYESCACNLGISNGPMGLNWFTDNPFINIVPFGHFPGYNPATPQWWTHSAGITPPEQFPWFHDNQRIEFGKMDTLDNIEAAWAAHYRADRMIAA